MSGVKHTPGPWHLGRDADEDAGFGWFVAAGGYCRADIVGPICDTEANAHLISAAPDLLEALELSNEAWFGKNMDMNALCEKVQAAIAKAKGGAS